MKLSILAGFLIGMGGIVNLIVGDALGAIFFSLGLITICTFKYSLFTGKAGLLAKKVIEPWELCGIWIGNFVGTLCCAMLVRLTPKAEEISNAALKIVETRMAQTAIENIVLGIFCGILMYIAVTGYEKTNNYLFCVAPVVFFILCGFNHCVADMFYSSCISTTTWAHWSHLIATTFGNLIGTNIIPYLEREFHKSL